MYTLAKHRQYFPNLQFIAKIPESGTKHYQFLSLFTLVLKFQKEGKDPEIDDLRSLQVQSCLKHR